MRSLPSFFIILTIAFLGIISFSPQLSSMELEEEQSHAAKQPPKSNPENVDEKANTQPAFSNNTGKTETKNEDSLSSISKEGEQQNIPSLDELRQIYAIHATYQIPHDGVMRTGKAANADTPKYGLKKGDPIPGVGGWRPTLHWSLGSVCADLKENTLSDRNHIIIAD